MAERDANITNGDSASLQAIMSGALASIFRGKFCDVILPNRSANCFGRNAVIYEVGDNDRTLMFIRRGFAKIGTITPDGREIIYDIRKSGDVIGELCACEDPRPDRAVALEETEVVAVPFDEIMDILRRRPDLLRLLLHVFCRALTDAYAQINMLVIDDTLHRLVKLLLDLGGAHGQQVDGAVELPMYLTQEDISQMVSARRERISTALNSLRHMTILRACL
jgi:CRP/FNR family cyclic AMP-dependent transcriptional regulator